MSALRLSVITATVARRELMLRKLASLEEQTVPPSSFEWIVCDNGGESGIVEELERRSTPFRLRTVKLPVNRGPGAGRNACAALAAGDVFYLSDDDCLLPPDTIERHLAAQARPCVAVGGIEFRPDGGRPTSWRPRRARYWNVNGANTSLPAAAFRAVGGFDESLEGYGAEDVLLGYRLSRAGLDFRALPQAAVLHIGPDPAAGGDLAKAHSAGRNAALIARRYPELRFRLGVHPWLLRLKLTLMTPLARFAGPRTAGDLAYARGAWEVIAGSQPAPLRSGRS